MIRRCLFLFVFAASAALAAPSDSAPAAVDVVSAEFGVFDASNPREEVFEPTSQVPRREGQRYGWVIELRTSKRSLSVREEYLLPSPQGVAPAADAERDSLNIPLERRSQVSQRQLVPVDGKIYGEWAIGAGEPAGHRHLQVVIEGRVAASFEFDVK